MMARPRLALALKITAAVASGAILSALGIAFLQPRGVWAYAVFNGLLVVALVTSVVFVLMPLCATLLYRVLGSPEPDELPPLVDFFRFRN
jgi:hypothetical protein